MSDFLSSGKRLADTLDQKTKSEFAEIDSFSEKFKKTLPDTIFLNNFYLRPSRLESVASFLRGTPDLRSWLPVYPSAEGSYQRLVAISELIEQLLIRSQNRAYLYHAYLANQWMRGNSLGELVANKIARSGAEGVDEINATIRELFRDLEEEFRYKYVK